MYQLCFYGKKKENNRRNDRDCRKTLWASTQYGRIMDALMQKVPLQSDACLTQDVASEISCVCFAFFAKLCYTE